MHHSIIQPAFCVGAALSILPTSPPTSRQSQKSASVISNPLVQIRFIVRRWMFLHLVPDANHFTTRRFQFVVIPTPNNRVRAFVDQPKTTRRRAAFLCPIRAPAAIHFTAATFSLSPRSIRRVGQHQINGRQQQQHFAAVAVPQFPNSRLSLSQPSSLRSYVLPANPSLNVNGDNAARLLSLITLPILSVPLLPSQPALSVSAAQSLNPPHSGAGCPAVLYG